MPDLIFSSTAVVNQITQLLRDRYHAGFPILKELLQNADDAEARRFVADFYDCLPGSEHATNPLLRAPGALIMNDGQLSDTDMEGIRTFGDSTKSHDSSRVGKFGIGQKAVFHLCDAFVVVANGHSVKSSWQVVNPFVGIKGLPGNVTERWEDLPQADRRLLADRFATVAWERCLGIWIPFRNPNLRVAPQAGFSATPHCGDKIADSWNKPSDLHTLLTMLRHLREVAIRREGKDLVALRVIGSAKRLSLVTKKETTEINRASGNGVRHLHGRIQRVPGGRSVPYGGLEALLPNHHLEKLKGSKYWPCSHTAFSPVPQREKGEPHGAISLWRDPRSHASELSISWAVFLPVSKEEDITISIEGPSVGRVRLLLHGYFFLDSGRQRIDGIDGSRVRGEPIDESETRQAWNAELCNSVVLPLLPRVLHDALAARVLKPNALRSLLMGLAGHDWFRHRRSAICRKHALVCVLEPAGSRPQKPKWQLLSAKSKLRPLPSFVVQTPRRLTELFPEVHAFAASHELVLCTHVDASLVAHEMSWSADELNELFSSLEARAFFRVQLIRPLAEFLRLIESDNAALLAAVAGQIVGVLRTALLGRARLADAKKIASVLGRLPDVDVRIVPGAPPNRRLLRVLAKSESTVLIVPETHMPNGSHRVDKKDLTALLKALEPEVREADSEAASRTALALIQGHGNSSAIASDPTLASLAVLRGRKVGTAYGTDGEVRGKTVFLSIRDIRDHVARGLLFAGSPDANKALPILARAIPGISPVILVQRIAKVLNELAMAELVPRNVDKRSLCRAVREAADYGPADARRQLIECLRGMPGSEDRQVRQALRCLCAGAREAVDLETSLYYLEGGLEGLERVIRVLLKNDRAAFLVHPEITDALPPSESKRLGLQAIGLDYFDRIAQDRGLRAALASFCPTRDERAILLRRLDSGVTRKLPIFARTDGTVGPATKMFRETDKWSVPWSLKDRVLLLEPSRQPQARLREEAIVQVWTPTQQIKVALETSDAHRYQREILDALAEVGDVKALGAILVDVLRDSRWLIAGSEPVAPAAMLDLPGEVAREARSLETGGSIPSFVSRQDLPSDVRDHPGFSMLAPKILPCRSKSLERLASLLDESPLIGRLGSAEDYPLDEFRTLAGKRADLALPGWPLLAAVLRSVERAIEARRIVGILGSAKEQHQDLAIDHLNALATVSSAAPDSALAACRHAFRAMVRWSEQSRKAVFSKTRVPTGAGDWRTGREVIPRGKGLSRGFVLDRECAQILGSNERANRLPGDQSGEPLAPRSTLGGWTIHRGYQHLHDLDRKALEQQADFLKGCLGCIPTRLVVVYLALLGTRELLGSLVQSRATTHDIETWWEETRSRLKLKYEHRLLVDIYRGNTIRAVSLSGYDLEVPPSAGSGELIRGNGHKTGTIYVADDGVERHVSRLRIRDQDIRELNGGNSDAAEIFRRFVETVAVDCVKRWTESDRQALASLLDRAIKVNQTTLRDTTALMQDELHSTLSGLKPERDSMIWKALSDFRDRRDRATALGKSPTDIAVLKADLWNAMETPEAQVELLHAIRSKIEEYGYSTDRIVFELLQNADDAYHQLHGRGDVSCFVLRVRSGERGGFQAIHWGRVINDFGSNPDEGRRRGYGRDLHNMLLMSFSEKRRGDGLTGQFGLGFKTVHMLSDSVGIASRFLAVRTKGGLIPRPWPQGANASDQELRDGQQATVIDVPFVEGRRRMGQEAVKIFREAMVWLPLFARQIRRIEFEDSKLTTVERRDGERIADGARVVTVLGDSTERVLMFDVRDGYSLVLRLDRDGPVGFSSALPRLWNLAPLQESVSAGCLLNGPFPLDPGRGRLAGAIDGQRAIMEKRGDAFGDCLQSLYDAATADWEGFCKALDLRGGHESQWDFWSRLFDIVAADLGDPLTRNLHGLDRGYGYLAFKRPVVPTRLPDPCGGLVTAANVKHRAAGALTDEDLQRDVLRWPVVTSLTGSLVARPVADQLRRLGFEPAEDLSVAKVLERQLGDGVDLVQRARRPEHADPMGGRVGATLAEELGKLINMKSIESAPLDQERTAILAVARQARFRCQDGGWHPVRQVSARLGGDEDLLCDFAPNSCVLDAAYQGHGLEFFKVARRESGYGPQAKDLLCWAREANDQEDQRAALWYLIEGRLGGALAEALQSDRLGWLPPRSGLFSHRLLDGWSDADKQNLARRLYPRHTTVVIENNGPIQKNGTQIAGNVLSEIHDWWMECGQEQRRHYEQHVYPESFDVFPFQNSSGSWFTLFAMARFQNLGRVSDAQNRTFIDKAYNDGWWKVFALTEGNEVAVDLLDAWSDPEQPNHAYRPWRNTLVDLYSIARGLDAYSAVMRRLPRIIREKGRVSLRQLLYPTQSDVHMRLGTMAAPIDSPIGFGINWMIRELVRNGFYSHDDAEVLAPYCWSARARVRRLLDHLGSNLGNDADMDASKRIWDFVREHLGEEQADFGGDFDLPLHLITLKKNTDGLNDFFR